MSAHPSRRGVMRASLSLAALVALGCRHVVRLGPSALPLATLEGDDEPLLALPPGFSYVVVQRAGDVMSDGVPMPLQPDGMTCHALDDGTWVLLRNHELGWDEQLRHGGLDPTAMRATRPTLAAGAPLGGVARVVLDPRALRHDLRAGAGGPSGAVLRSEMILEGTALNCSGGATPTGWISCEEAVDAGHGYAFRLEKTDEGLVNPAERRLLSWGRFRREAVALDPVTGVAYQTEDAEAGCLYRHVPAVAGEPMGPGRLEALSLPGVVHSDRYSEVGQSVDAAAPLVVGDRWDAEWVAVPDASAEHEPCSEQAGVLGATWFNRCEGIARDGQGRIWFVASLGGPLGAGQLWRLDPTAGTVTLVREVTDRSELSMPDNLVFAPWGDLLLCEDNYSGGDGCTHQYMRGLTPGGEVYDILRNEHNGRETGRDVGAELTGVCFSPDGAVMFVNLQYPESVTVAVSGPWPRI